MTITKPNQLPTEDWECKAFAKYLEQMQQYKKILAFTHIPNETSIKNMAYLSKMKAMGKRAGAPDYLVITRKGFVFVEMKRQKNENGTTASKVSPLQEEWGLKIAEAGGYFRICYGYNDAVNFIQSII